MEIKHARRNQVADMKEVPNTVHEKEVPNTYMSKIKLFQLPITITIPIRAFPKLSLGKTQLRISMYFYPIKLNYTTVNLN